MREKLSLVFVLVGVVLVAKFASPSNNVESQALPMIGVISLVLGSYFYVRPKEKEKQKSFHVSLLVFGVILLAVGVVFLNSSLYFSYGALAGILFIMAGISKLLPDEETGTLPRT